MKSRTGLLLGGAFVVLMAGILRADEEKIELDKLPRAVVEAVKDKFPKGKLVSAEKEKEDGKTVYEVNLKDGDQTVEVTVTPEGKIVSIEKVIAAKDAPKEVTEALESKYPKAKIKKVEEVTEGDKPAVYEFLIVTAEKETIEVVLDAKGKVVKEEKKKKQDKD